MSDDWRKRLTRDLEPILELEDPRPAISAYHDMPYAIFRYSPEDEFEVRREVTMLKTRLEQRGKRVTRVSLAERLEAGLKRASMSFDELAAAEKRVGLPVTLNTVAEVLSEYEPLDQLVAQAIPADADPLQDVVFIQRAGALFPFYRTSALLDQLQGQIDVPAVLFYPGELDGAAGLRFMGVLDPEHNYRPKIF